MSFLITPLPRSAFQHLFGLPVEALARYRAMRVTATKKPGFPCRLSLADAEIGEELILAHFEHHDVETPFRAGHAVYVRPNAAPFRPVENAVPEMLRSRVLSVRAFDERGMLIGAELADGADLMPVIETLFENSAASYLHIHFAKPGCYGARVNRA